MPASVDGISVWPSFFNTIACMRCTFVGEPDIPQRDKSALMSSRFHCSINNPTCFKASARRDAASGPAPKGVDLGVGSVDSTDSAMRQTLRGVLGCRSKADYLTKDRKDDCLEVQGREARNAPTFALTGAKQTEWAADMARQKASPVAPFVPCPSYTQLSNFGVGCLRQGP